MPDFYVAPGAVGIGRSPSDPCSLSKAVSNVNNQLFPTSSVIHLAPGYYTQPRLTLTGIGARFICDGPGRAILTGATFRPQAETWEYTLLTGVFRTPMPTFPVGIVTQLRPQNWRRILVDDHTKPPVRTSYGRPFHLEQPVQFKYVNSIAEVARQSGTWHATGGHVYVHMYHDGAPTLEDDLWLGAKDAGSLVVVGGDNQFENIGFEHTSGTAFWVQPKAARTRINNLVCVDAQVWLEGFRTEATNLDLSHCIKQGNPTNIECYDANPDFGMGEAWNAFGDGRALLVGREGTAHEYNQDIRNVRIHRGWNGARVDGPNYCHNWQMWGFANHTLEMSGSNIVLENSIFLNGQDSLFVRGMFGGWRIAHNIFFNAVYATVSNNGSGGAANRSWEFNHNIVTQFTVDKWAFESLDMHHNLWMNSGNNLFRIIDTNGVRGVTLRSLQEMRTRLDIEHQSKELDSQFWTTGRRFQFGGQGNPSFDFKDPLRMEDGDIAGPENLE